MTERKPPKICHFSSVHAATDTRILAKETQTLAAAGYRVVLIARHHCRETLGGVEVIPLPEPRGRLQRMFGLTRHVYRLARQQQADLYHFHDPELLPVGLWLKITTRKPVVYDVHEDYPRFILTKYWIPWLLRYAVSFLVNIVEKIVARAMDGIIPVTDEIEKRFRKIRRAKVVQVRNYPVFDLPYERAAAKENYIPSPLRGEGQNSIPSPLRGEGQNNIPSPRRGEGQGGGDSPSTPAQDAPETTLIYVGVLNRIRGLFHLVKALEHIDPRRRYVLELFGRFDEPGFEGELRALPAFHRVRFGGWAARDEVWKHLLRADIGFVLFHPVPNHTEALPNKLFEYMSAGLPVIASAFPLWQEIVEGNRCGLTVDPYDTAAIARAAEHLMDTPSLREEMGRNGRRAVLEKYNWEKEGEKLLELYRTLLNKEASTHASR